MGSGGNRRFPHGTQCSGEFTRRERLQGKLRVVSTQGIDGTWGRLKTFLRSRMSNVKEFQWRTNLASDADPFIHSLWLSNMVVSSDLLLL